MLKTRTVFVLGAGSSVPYGFSTGQKLLEKARALSMDEIEGRISAQHARQIRPLHEALAGTIMSSIDATLEHRPLLWAPLKTVMASLLIDEEQEARNRIPPVDEDWLALIVEYMATGATSIQEFAGNPVSFVTFNYDRLLEYRLGRGLAQHYGIQEPAVWQALSGVAIVHVHGSLGLLPEQRVAHDTMPVPFGFFTSIAELATAVQCARDLVRIVHEAHETDDAFVRAQELILAAQQVIFLGFSYGAENIQHLGTRAIPELTRVYCTTYGMTNAEITDRLEPAFPRHGGPPYLLHADQKIRQFLRENISVFR
jgi:SIR2-like domain